ncbi:signal peptide peptidase SppA [Nakamurella sp.]|uniref:signal peptide peptidase SppA n=1 Tax=Nakamurella sp. TaxID=1869182 RepID=UPI003B3BE497
MDVRPAKRILLELDLTELPVELEQDDPLSRLRHRGRRDLRSTIRALHRAADDPRVVGLVARVGGPAPWPAMQELRAAVEAFAAGGKPTVAWAETFGEQPGAMAGYVLATAFDQLWLQPGGELGLLGVGLETTFLRGALDKLGVEPQFEQRYEFKSAADRIMRTGFTDAHRTALQRLVESVFDDAVETIARARRLDVATVRDLVDRGPHLATAARDAGLVDRLGYRDEALAAMRARVGERAELLFADRWRPRRRLRPPRRSAGHVALVQVRGGIAAGRSRRTPLGRTAGSDTVCASLRAAAADERARAVVLLVDSPGGSAVASDTIWREVVRLQQRKPVVVAMGAVAASGGYYIACPADRIVALPATLTGSIGVLGGKLVTGGLLERVGLTTGAVAQGRRALMFSSRRSFDEGERHSLGAAMDAIYDDFVDKVAAGRGRPRAEIEQVARGRVWTGRDALAVGLGDRLGGLRDAVARARSRAGLPDDAPLRPAVRVGPLARLGRPRNSADPRAGLAAGLPRLDGLSRAVAPAGPDLTMPSLRLR